MGNLDNIEMGNEEQATTGAAKDGQHFYGVELQNRTDVMFYADQVAIEPSGVLCAYRKRDEGMHMTLAWATDRWNQFWAASVVDGNPIAVDSIISSENQGLKVKFASPSVAKKTTRKRGAAK